MIKNCENEGIKHLNDSKAFIECSNTIMIFTRILIITIQTEEEKLLGWYGCWHYDKQKVSIINQRIVY